MLPLIGRILLRQKVHLARVQGRPAWPTTGMYAGHYRHRDRL